MTTTWTRNADGDWIARIEPWQPLMLIALLCFFAAGVEACIGLTDSRVRVENGLRRVYGDGSEVACPYHNGSAISCWVRRPDGAIVRVRCDGEGCREIER